MSKRLVLCEGPDDLNALRAIAQLLRWAQPVRTPGIGAGQERQMVLQAGIARIEVSVPSKARGATGEGKSALSRGVATALEGLPPQTNPADEAHVSLVAAVFDPDDETAADFHTALVKAVRDHATAWTFAESGSPGVWHAQRGATEQLEVRAVDWRAPGGVLDRLPDQMNLERLLCAVLAQAYPDDVSDVARWLTEVGGRCAAAGRKPPTWKAAIHVWLAVVYEKADELNAAARFLHQQDECRPHVERILDAVGLVRDLRPLLGPP
jgi:hypothetical protein